MTDRNYLGLPVEYGGGTAKPYSAVHMVATAASSPPAGVSWPIGPDCKWTYF